MSVLGAGFYGPTEGEKRRRGNIGGMTVHSVTVGGMSLDSALARKLRRAADQVKAATELRNRLICEASAAGASLRDVAAHAGITHVGVMKVIDRAAGRRKGAAS